jgi:hypothetical protein
MLPAAGDHDAPDRFQHAPQFAHHRPDEFGRRQDEDLVVGLDDGVALGIDRLVLAEDRRDAGIDPGRQVFAHGLDRFADQQAALVGAHADQRHAPGGKFKYL